MKGPPMMKGMGKPKGMPNMGGGGGTPKPGLVTGGNMSGLSQGLSSARPVKAGRMASLKKSMFGGGM